MSVKIEGNLGFLKKGEPGDGRNTDNESKGSGQINDYFSNRSK